MEINKKPLNSKLTYCASIRGRSLKLVGRRPEEKVKVFGIISSCFSGLNSLPGQLQTMGKVTI